MPLCAIAYKLARWSRGCVCLGPAALRPRSVVSGHRGPRCVLISACGQDLRNVRYLVAIEAKRTLANDARPARR
jgi:hypothetical protein